MFVTTNKSTIKTIKPGDRAFTIQGDLIVTDRASIEIDPRCPSRYANLILECYNNGWIKPVAHVTEQEYTFIGLTR